MKILASALSLARASPSSAFVPSHHPSMASNSQSIFLQANLKPPDSRLIRFNHTRCALFLLHPCTDTLSLSNAGLRPACSSNSNNMLSHSPMGFEQPVFFKPTNTSSDPGVHS